MTASEGPGVLAVDLGGTRMRVAVFSAAGEMVHRTILPTPREDPGALIEAMRAVRDDCGIAIEGAAVGVPGVVSYADGTVLRAPNLPGWEGALAASRIGEGLGLSVVLANDADLAALGEYHFGAGKGAPDMVYVTSSTGVGAGVIIDGRLLRAARSLAEVGHTIIDYHDGATVESLGSGTALERIAGADPAVVEARARAGDPEAQRLFRAVADALATGVFNLAHLFMPTRVVIGGGMSRAGELLLGPVRERLGRCSPDCPLLSCEVVAAANGDDAGLVGAYSFWREGGGRGGVA